MDIDKTGKVLREYIFENKGINTPFGKAEYISSNNPLGQGGNGIVYPFRMNDKEIAIKFLLSDQSEKRSRFWAVPVKQEKIKSPDFLGEYGVTSVTPFLFASISLAG